MPMGTSRYILHCNLPLIFLYMLNAASLSTSITEEKTVNIGVILDSADVRSDSITTSLKMAMKASNKSKSPNMHPLFNKTDLNDSFNLTNSFCKIISLHPIAMFGISGGEAYSVLKSFSSKLKIPMFLPIKSRGSNEKDFLIKMCPSFVDAVIDVIKFFRWERIFYLYDTNDAIWRLQKIYQAFSDVDDYTNWYQPVIEAVRVPDVNDSRDLLQKLDKQFNIDAKIFVLDLHSLEDYNALMKQIVQVGMNKDGYHYILGTLDINGMDKSIWKSFKYGGVNVTGFELVKLYDIRNIPPALWDDGRVSVDVALNVDAVAVLTTAILKMIQLKIIRFRGGHLYLNMSCFTNPVQVMEKGESVLQTILNVTLEGSNKGISGKVAFDEYGNRKGYKLYLYHLSFKSEFRQIGYWEEGVGLRDMSIKSGFDKVEEKSDNDTLIVTTIISEPFVQMKKEDNGTSHIGNDRFEGYCIDMMKLLAEKIGFNYTIKLVDDGEFGSKESEAEDSSWNGLIGELLRKEAHIALASLSITRKRQEVVYFTKPFMSTGISIMIKKPEKERPSVFSFMQPLSFKVWGCILCGFLAVTFILYMVGRFSPFEWRNGDGEEKAPSDTFSFGNNIWYTLGALLQQGPDEFPRSLSGRVLASAWWFFTLIIISSYTANLAACLTFERLVTPINSVDDLVKQSKIKYGTQASGATTDFFKDSNVTVYKTMYEVMNSTLPSVFVFDTKAGVDRVIKGRGKYAFLLESSSNNYYNQRKPCETMKIGRNLDEKGYGLATRKNFPFGLPTRSVKAIYFSISSIRVIDPEEPRKVVLIIARLMSFASFTVFQYSIVKLNIALLEIRERGDLLKLEQKWWYQKGQCGGSSGGGKGKGLNLSNVSGIFHILISGLVLAVFISISQLVCHSCMKSRSKKSNYDVNNDIKVLEEEPLSGSHYRKPIEQRYNTF